MNGATPGDHHDFVRPVPVLVNDTQPRRWGDLECMPVTVVNPLSHPQVLFRWFEEDDPRLTRMRHLVGASHLLTGDTLKGLRAEDWDVLVVERAPVTASIPRDVHVLALDSPSLGRPAFPWGSMHFSGRQPSRTMNIAADLPADVRELVLGEAIPWLKTQEALPYMQMRRHMMGPTPSGGTPYFSISDIDLQTCWRMVSDADGQLVVGAFPRGNDGWCWAIPYRSEHPELWLAAALTHWRQTDPVRFREVNPWRAREPWVTDEEREAHGQLAELKTERGRVLAELKDRELALDSAVLVASQKAEQGARRLLTAQGEDLGEAVVLAFTDLGFDVQDLDEERDRSGLARVEDLNLTCPDQPEVRILAEVKGYAKGAKAGDLIQIGHHAVRYTQRQGVPPDRSWYVINQFIDRDPDLRPAPLAGAVEDVAAFADGGGLIIDTRELFQLAEAVSGGRVAAEAARAALLAQRGVFSGSSLLAAPTTAGGQADPA